MLSAKVLENVILQQLLRGEEIPENGDRLKAWLTDVGMEHSFYLEIFDITNQLEQVKQQIRAADTANFSARMGRTIRRILILMIILTTVPLERLCFFIDEPNSAERLAQYETMLQEELRRRWLGRALSRLPIPAGYDYREERYRRWFMNAAAGVNMQRPASRRTGSHSAPR